MNKSTYYKIIFFLLIFQSSISKAQDNFKTPYGNNKEVGKYVKINKEGDIEELFSNIMNDKYYTHKLNLYDSRPLWYYSHEYNKKKDEFSDDILKEFNFK